MDDKLLKRVLDVSGVNKFGWHDSRHTFSSHMNDYGTLILLQLKPA